MNIQKLNKTITFVIKNKISLIKTYKRFTPGTISVNPIILSMGFEFTVKSGQGVMLLFRDNNGVLSKYIAGDAAMQMIKEHSMFSMYTRTNRMHYFLMYRDYHDNIMGGQIASIAIAGGPSITSSPVFINAVQHIVYPNTLLDFKKSLSSDKLNSSIPQSNEELVVVPEFDINACRQIETDTVFDKKKMYDQMRNAYNISEEYGQVFKFGDLFKEGFCKSERKSTTCYALQKNLGTGTPENPLDFNNSSYLTKAVGIYGTYSNLKILQENFKVILVLPPKNKKHVDMSARIAENCKIVDKDIRDSFGVTPFEVIVLDKDVVSDASNIITQRMDMCTNTIGLGSVLGNQMKPIKVITNKLLYENFRDKGQADYLARQALMSITKDNLPPD